MDEVAQAHLDRPGERSFQRQLDMTDKLSGRFLGEAHGLLTLSESGGESGQPDLHGAELLAVSRSSSTRSSSRVQRSRSVSPEPAPSQMSRNRSAAGRPRRSRRACRVYAVAQDGAVVS
ncbi:hypothetical protein [Streptomyces sp. NBC_00190]|uniref:hypothetical protein n=1 Tax=Streptomyces sp. NBC_00190 TaxID=2903634 RepID=UPI003FA712F3